MLDRAVAKKRMRWVRRIALFVAISTAALGVASASAELTQKGNLFVRFGGGIAPVALPRSTPAPISVQIEGKIRVLSGQTPPSLRLITISLNRAGRLDSVGLPVCHRGRIASADPSEALAACAPSLVGSGGLVAKVDLTHQEDSSGQPLEETRVRGSILLFNGVSKGRPAIFAQVYQRDPPATYLIVFSIKRTAGTYGTVLSGEVPPSVIRHGYLESIFLKLERRYTYRGRQRSYLTANCGAPPGFPGAIFPFAHASMGFDDGRTLSSTLVRSCKVRN